MNESQISVRYAKALFLSAAEQKQLDTVYKDMELLSDTCKLEDFQYLLVMPSLQASQKRKLVDSVFKKYLSDLSMSMINLVIKNKREVYLPGIARNFSDLYRKSKGIRAAKLVTAGPVDDATIKSIRDLIKKAYDADVELSSSVDGDVIGGFVLTIEDMQYDASVASSLRKIKKQLLQTSIEK
ncbi:MAG: ATP synthase F1 subunit delta [Bacteroidales bacterium]|nr:ATP synthase F1 subunit delta [Bacteroidales bacterium]